MSKRTDDKTYMDWSVFETDDEVKYYERIYSRTDAASYDKRYTAIKGHRTGYYVTYGSPAAGWRP